ncbi:heavy metal translocating P-type ATPase [Dehalogenimonas sp. 4OHTPN]|uniref:Copper-exporting P-type ATPase n=1 Tax=Dehalogenimonas sp. 4OHTPN TaxID=3166643 RepID=A0AAU8GAP3_9CHLR
MAIEQEFEIEGMDCAECAEKIEAAVSKIRGVASAQVLLSSSKLIVKPENGELQPGEVVKIVERLGYKIKPDKAAQSIALYVEGMDCADELAIIEKKFKNLPGLANFEVNLASQKVDVTYDPSRLSSQDIIKAIAETGMNARLAKTKARAKAWWQDFRVKLIAASGTLLLIAFILERIGLDHNIARFIYGASILVGGYFPAKMALAGLRARTLNIYTLLIFATIGAVGLGFWDEAAFLVFVYTWGAILETYATERARGSLKLLMELVPREALVKRDSQELALPVEEVRVGETVIVRPGERIPLDGTVMAGSSSVDQAPITGESIPVSKAPGDPVFAGSINQRGSLELKVSRLSQDTTLARIIHSVERSEAKKSSYQHFAERFSRIYTPAMFIVAIFVAVVPWLLGQPFTPWFYRALVVLVVSCSCGLALSVPISVLASVSAAAKKGVLIKGGADLEAAGSVDAIVFDKTGTLTIGLPKVADLIALNGSAPELLAVAASVESRSEHPLADAILRKAREDGVGVQPLEAFEALTGLGAKGTAGGNIYYVCNRRLCEQLDIPLENAEADLVRLESEGKTAVLVLGNGKVMGIIAVSDQLRPGAKEAIISLKKAGIKHIAMLTGDNEGTARAIASQTGIDEYKAQLMPEDKVAAVEELKRKYYKIAMVGDGVNDAPAMAAADVGIAMGAAGTDIALETADLALMSDDLSRIPYAFAASRKAVAVIKQNVVASVGIVVVVVALALFGKIGLVPGLLINEGSALIVMANGLRLLRG